MTLPQSFIQAIRENTADDGIRLVAADWFEENGEPKRAEYIRLACESHRIHEELGWLNQKVGWSNFHPTKSSPRNRILLDRDRLLIERITELVTNCGMEWIKDSPLFWAGCQTNSTWVPSFDWYWERGFVKTVCCTLRDWYGGKCHACIGKGGINVNQGTRVGVYDPWVNCRHCKGKGDQIGHGPEIMRSEPVLEVIVFDPNDVSLVNSYEDGTRDISRMRVGKELWKYMAPDHAEKFYNTFRGSPEDVQNFISDGLIRWALSSGGSDGQS